MREKGINVSVDVLKCIAALMVFLCHSYIACSESFEFEFTSGWQFFLKTPAWGGVWIFMIVSGFLAGGGFFSGKYSLTLVGIGQYYKNRILKVVIPTWIMISLVYILADFQIPSLKVMVLFLTCMFRGSGAAEGVGATWYVFSIAWMYFLSPIFVLLLKRLEHRFFGKEERIFYCLFMFFACIGVVYRIGGRMLGLEWYRWIYASPLGNLDLFLGGMIISRIRYFADIKQKIRISFELLLLFTVIFCEFCYFYGETTKPMLLSVYRYLMPTVFLAAAGGGIVLLVGKNNSK